MDIKYMHTAAKLLILSAQVAKRVSESGDSPSKNVLGNSKYTYMWTLLYKYLESLTE